MSIKQESIWAALPSTSRGQPTPLSADAKGERIAYASNKSIFIRNIDDPSKSRQYTGHTAQTTVARFSPSGFYIASGDVSGKVRVWDTAGEEMITKGEYPIIAGRINDIAWDGDSQRIIAVGDGKGKFGHCFTADSGNTVGEISGHAGQINCVSVRQQRPLRAVTGSDDTSLVFLHGAPFKFNSSIRGKHTKYVYGTQFSPDGTYFVSVGSDKVINVFDGKTGEWQKAIGNDEHKGSIFGVSWAKDSKLFATCSADQTVKVWDVESGKVVHSWRLGEEGTLKPEYQQVGVIWPHGRTDNLIISLDLGGNLNYLKVGEAAPSKTIQGHQRNITAVAKSESGALWTGGADGRICSWDSKSGLAKQPDGETHSNYISGLVAAGSSHVSSIAWDDTLRTIDVSSNTFAGTAPVKLSGQPTGLAFASQIGQTAVITPAGIELFDKAGSLAGTVPTKDYQATSIAISTDSKFVAVGAAGKAVHIYAPAGGAQFKVVAVLSESLKSNVSALAFSPDSSHLAVGTQTGPIVVYSTADWSVATSRWTAHASRINGIAWRPDGAAAVSGSLDTNVHVWSLAQPGKRVKASNAHKEGVSGVAWGADANTCYSVGADATVKVWKVEGL